MTDHELLELAAKAAGYAFRKEISPIGIDLFYVDDHHWNPLTDDGDALRLAVKLCLVITSHGESVEVWIGDIECEEFCNNDPYAATRRAIVRAAAEIGKGMK